MCYTLNVEDILLNYFSVSKDKTTISFNELNQLSNKIVLSCNDGIIAETSRDDIENLINRRDDLFRLREDVISLIDQDNFLIKNIFIVNQNLPHPIANKCIEVCENF